MFLLKVLLLPFILHSYILRDATLCQCIASHTAVLQRNYEAFDGPQRWLADDFCRGRERFTGRKFGKSLFHLHIHKNPANSRGKESARLCEGWEERGNQGYALFALHNNWLTMQNTSLSAKTLADPEILGSGNKPWTKISPCPTKVHLPPCRHQVANPYQCRDGGNATGFPPLSPL